MEGDRERDRPSSRWRGDEWPDADWEREGARQEERRPRIEDRGERPRGRYQGGMEEDDHLPHVEDDPLYDTLPGERAPRAHHQSTGGRQAERFGGRRARPGLSWGQKLLLWVGFAIASGVSFGAGLVVGASGGLDIPGFSFLKPRAEEIPEPTSLEALGPPPEPDRVIEFGERGKVPSEADATAPQTTAPQTTAPAADKGTASAAAARPAKEETPAPDREAATSAPAPAAPKQAAAPSGTTAAEDQADDQAEEMTFYETATGKRAAPGLAETDEEAPAEPESPGAPAPRAPAAPAPVAAAPSPPAPAPAAQEDAGIPSGAELLAKRRALAPAAERGEAPAPPATGQADVPSGAAFLARHQAAAAVETPPAPSPGGMFTVQVSTLSDEAAARGLARRLSEKGYDARVVPLTRPGLVTLYRVRVGRYASEAAARADLDRLQNEPGTHPYIRIE